MSSFIEKCLAHEATPEDIDDYIELWHQNPGDQPLHEYLGMTRNEYALWIVNAAILPTLLNIRSKHQSMDQLLAEFDHQFPATAKSTSPSGAMALMKWLKVRLA
ncbi:hypothetical protein D0T25_18390 [Duganella sp. BJB488]|uniref:hypothetical protein n=1 Tax=unclassified Duganella TaxID=2636909 RepID=UPI000E34EEED|nr:MULTISPECIES: hypothetical protein [unclassified Duganella]RFP16625.1 hypothetical protein D0T26_17140 [Duganella sp. BJB489]RFP20949.1 hypothetical protein D0T25_18390 [Duganella sp. BJB488]RFP31988.1 hypothetical protein D0T24_20515 [Duganella sp. BJB480]